MTEGNGKNADVVVLGGGRCTICGKPAVARFRPFCSNRCADRDLGHWLDGDYRIPAVDDAEPDDDETLEE